MMQQFVMYLFPCGESGNAVEGGEICPCNCIVQILPRVQQRGKNVRHRMHYAMEKSNISIVSHY
jgi:hypothetical protein